MLKHKQRGLPLIDRRSRLHSLHKFSSSFRGHLLCWLALLADACCTWIQGSTHSAHKLLLGSLCTAASWEQQRRQQALTYEAGLVGRCHQQQASAITYSLSLSGMIGCRLYLNGRLEAL